jgi:hypothetical protein
MTAKEGMLAARLVFGCRHRKFLTTATARLQVWVGRARRLRIRRRHLPFTIVPSPLTGRHGAGRVVSGHRGAADLLFSTTLLQRLTGLLANVGWWAAGQSRDPLEGCIQRRKRLEFEDQRGDQRSGGSVYAQAGALGIKLCRPRRSWLADGKIFEQRRSDYPGHHRADSWPRRGVVSGG